MAQIICYQDKRIRCAIIKQVAVPYVKCARGELGVVLGVVMGVVFMTPLLRI